MNIGFVIGRIGGVDGVALEAEKWIEVLHKMNYNTFILSGQYEGRRMNSSRESILPELSFFSPQGSWGQQKAFFEPTDNPDELLDHIEHLSDKISDHIINWVRKFHLDIIISENASALPAHLSMGLGIKKAAQILGIPIITHDHDFAWERGERYLSKYYVINQFVADTFPLRLENSFHAVINEHGKKTIKEKYGRESIVVPNVMNFDMPFAEITEDNSSLRKDLGLKSKDIPLFQITRIVRRKGIEVAIDLVHRLKDKNIKLIITGSQADDEGNLYYNELVDRIMQHGLSKQVVFASHVINNRGLTGNLKSKKYSLSDAYAHARACTYFSTYEGFGNAFVEAVLARRPIFVNNYKPVYWPDIGSKGFKTVMLEDNNLTDEAVSNMAEMIYNDKINREVASYNFELGRKYFSYDTLEEKLTELISWAKKQLT